jgi:hypothetical protein
MHRFLISALLLIGFGLATLPSSVEACPMCKVANEDAPATDADGFTIDPNARPRAYMISILFMLAMPASLLTGFGIAFYRMTHRQPEPAPANEAQSDDHDIVG